MPRMNIVWHASDITNVFMALDTNSEGLSSEEAALRLARDGKNKTIDGEGKTGLEILLGHLLSPVMLLLIAACLLFAVLGQMIDSIVVFAVIILNAATGTILESRAEAALDSLRQMTAHKTTVLRDGVKTEISAADLVVGDVVFITKGDTAPVDLRLIKSDSLAVTEAALTGEAEPIYKITDIIDDHAATLGQRLNMVHLGSQIVSGSAFGVVTARGYETQAGKMSIERGVTKAAPSPFQRRLSSLTNLITLFVVGVAVLVFIIGRLTGGDGTNMFMISVSLVVAAIPEGLAATAAIAAAICMQHMAGGGVVVKKPDAAELLGTTAVICFDASMLSAGKSTVSETWSGSEDTKPLLGAMFHTADCTVGNNGQLEGPDAAVMDYLLGCGVCTVESISSRRRAGEYTPSERLKVVVINLSDTVRRVFLKGSPEEVLRRCGFRLSGRAPAAMDETAARKIAAAYESMQSSELEPIAFAYLDLDKHSSDGDISSERDFVFCGFAGIRDEIKAESADTIFNFRGSGILPVLFVNSPKGYSLAKSAGLLSEAHDLTGDELEGLDEIGLNEIIDSVTVLSGASSEQKARFIAAHSSKGRTVSVIGSQVEDISLLEAADIGISPELSGCGYAREVSDIVLTGDRLSALISAVGEGRRLLDNISKTVRYLFTSNAGELLAVLAAAILGWHLLAPIHILWINLVTDTLPALALGTLAAEEGLMKRRPKKAQRPILYRRDWANIGLLGLVEAALTIAAYLLGNMTSPAIAMTMAFMTLSLSQLVTSFSFASDKSVSLDIGKDSLLLVCVLISAALQLITVLIPQVRELFGLAMPGALQWLEILVLSFVLLVFAEFIKRRGN